jgi:hypothetical protein
MEDSPSTAGAKPQIISIVDAQSKRVLFVQVSKCQGEGHPFRVDITDGQAVWRAGQDPRLMARI